MEEHYTKKGVYPVEVIPILPDSEMWKFPCAQVNPLPFIEVLPTRQDKIGCTNDNPIPTAGILKGEVSLYH
jgi:hypothetical protein